MKRTYTLFVVILAMGLLALAVIVQAQDDATPIELGETTTGTLGEDMPSVAFTFTGAAGTYAIITMNSDDFDTYLVLMDSADEVIAEDDDSGGGLNAEIAVTLPADDEYVILATSLHAYLSEDMVFAEGDFSLTLEVGDAPPVEPTEAPRATATPVGGLLNVVGSLTIGDSTTGELTNSAPNAGYTFTASAGDSVIVTLESDDFDPYLILQNADGDDLQSDDDSGGNLYSRIGPFEIPADGTYTIVVESYRHYNSGEVLTGSYSVSLQSGDAPVVMASPVPTATPLPPPTVSPPVSGEELALGDTVMGALSDSALSLEYTFTAAAGDQVTISLFSDDFDAFLTLLDANGNELAADDDGAGGLHSRISSFRIPADGSYVIVVDSYDHARANSSAVGGFTLALESEVPDTPVVMGEGTIVVGDTVTGELSITTPGIEYEFTAFAGDMVTITLTSTYFDAYLVLLDDNGNELDRDDDSAGSLNARIGPFEIPADGQYVIQVESFGSATGGAAGAGVFTLSLAGEASVPVVTEGTIRIGDVVSGNLTEMEPSVDYTFFGAAGDVVTITLTSDDFDTYLYLLDSGGFELVFDDDSGGGVNSQITGFRLPGDGMYTIVADSYDNANMNVVAVGAYTLSLSAGEVVPIASETIELGETVAGFMDGNVIEYSFDATAGELVTITLQSDDFDSYLVLRDSLGMELAYDDDSAGNLHSRISAFTVPNDGLYTIVVDSYGHATGGDLTSGRYTLTLAAAEVWPIEYTQEVEGALDVDNPVAIYTFSGSVGDLVTVTLDSSGMSLSMRLEEADGFFVDEMYDGTSIGPIPLPATGDYRVTIETYDVYQRQAYTLMVNHIVPMEIALDYEVETRFDESGVQYYSFEGQAGDAISVQVYSDGLVDTFVTITGPDGYEIYYDDDSGAGFDPEIESLVLPGDGVYSVLVQPYILGDNGDFTLIIGDHAIPSVDEGVQVVRVSDKNPEGLVIFEGLAGERVLVSARVLVKGTEEPRIEVWQNDQILASNSIGMVQRVAIEFVVPEDGLVRVMLTGNYYSASVIEFSLERLED